MDESRRGPSLDETAASPDSLDETLAAGPDLVVTRRTDREESVEEVDRGTVVGRYIVLDRLGAGAMGVVHAAYDPELDRKVALKMLRADDSGPRGSSQVSSDGRARLLREAQALAKLSHPNAVAIHDVGTHAGQVWLAMEFVPGQTFGEWMKRTPRRWREILDVLLAAGRGLAAAHAKGLVHRDVKPENIMVADDGRVRIMDFGLARAGNQDVAALLAKRSEAATPELTNSGEDRLSSRSGSRPEWSTDLTRAGALLGTPAYMAPEQFAGGEVGPAADQFALCVMAWEAVYGRRPFAGNNLFELATNVMAAKLGPPPSGSAPSWLRRILARGLAREPEQRWPDVAALLDELARGQTRRQVRVSALVLAGVAGLAGGSWLWQRGEHSRRVEACGDESVAAAKDMWNEDLRADVRSGLLASKAGNAQTTLDKLEPWLDEHADAWALARRDVCVASEVDEIWDPVTRAHADWCLDDRRLHFESLISELGRADATVVQRAVGAAANLPAPASCSDRSALARMPEPPPAELRDSATAILHELARTAALEAAGRYAPGLELARTTAVQAEAIAWPALSALAKLRTGSLLGKTAAHAEAEAMLADAYFEAAEAGATELVAEVATSLIQTVGIDQARHDDGRRWARHAELALESLGETEGLASARRTNFLAAIEWAAGNYPAAQRMHEQTLAIRESSLGQDHPEVAHSLNNLAGVHFDTGQYEQAEALHHRALDVRERALGPDHPDVAASLSNLATIRDALGDHAEAAELHSRALVIAEAALGPDHPQVAATLNNLAIVHFAMRDYEATKRESLRALAIWERTLGPDHPQLGASMNNLAAAHYELGDLVEAKRLLDLTLASWEGALGVEHPYVAHPLVGLAKIALSEQRFADAISLAERALALRQKAGVSAIDLAEARFVLARASWTDETRREAAEDLAEQALEAYRAAPGRKREVEEIEAWLANPAGGPR